VDALLTYGHLKFVTLWPENGQRTTETASDFIFAQQGNNNNDSYYKGSRGGKETQGMRGKEEGGDGRERRGRGSGWVELVRGWVVITCYMVGGLSES